MREIKYGQGLLEVVNERLNGNRVVKVVLLCVFGMHWPDVLLLVDRFGSQRD